MVEAKVKSWMIVITWLPFWELFAPDPRVTLLQLPLSLDTSSVEREIVEKEGKPSEKPPKPIKKTKEENQETTENILAL